jgi:ABC-type uncharacterized transport system involved in gliding motility auxiliary subunit
MNMQRILNIVAWFGVALVVVAVGLRFGPVSPEWSRYGFYLAWIGLLLVLLYPLGMMPRRQARQFAIVSSSVIVVLLVLIAVNYLANRRNKRWDLTENAIHSLSEQSQKVVASLDAPLKILVFDRADRLGGYRDRLSQYEGASSRLSVEYVDGELDPVRAKQFEVQAFPTLVLQYKDKTEKVQSVDEREITSAVIRVMSGTQRKAYFVQGHGERNPTDDAPTNFRGVAQLLKGDNITVETLVLSQQKDIPDDATVVVIAGPTADFLAEELDQVKRYLDKGGKLLLMVDPPLGQRVQPLTGLIGLAKDWGVEIGNDVVIDISGRTQQPEIVVAAPPYPNHPITESFAVATIFPVARSVTPVMPAPEGKTVQQFVESAMQAWAETDLAGLLAGNSPEIQTDKGDRTGPIPIAVAVNTPAPPADAAEDDPKTPPQTRIVVFGDSDFASDRFAGSIGNVDLFLNTINWLTAQENLISIRPKEPGNSRLTMTPGDVTLVRWFALAIVPGLVLLAGVLVWSRRRST